MKKKKKTIIDRIIKDRIIRDIWTLFETEEVIKQRRKLDKKKEETNDRLIKDRTTGDIRTL